MELLALCSGCMYINATNFLIFFSVPFAEFVLTLCVCVCVCETFGVLYIIRCHLQTEPVLLLPLQFGCLLFLYPI